MHWLKVKKDPSSPYIFSFPHSGVELCEEALNNLSDLGRRSLPNMDWHLNELYDFLYEYNVNIISTSMSRYVVDLNRELKKIRLASLNKPLFTSEILGGGDLPSKTFYL